MSTSTSRQPPMLPAKRVKLQADVRAVLATVPAGRGPTRAIVDTAAIDAAWPATWLSPPEVLAADVLRRRTGLATRKQVALRVAVVRWMDLRLEVRELRVGSVVFKLGQDRLVPTGDGFELRSGALRVTLDAAPLPKKAARPVGANLARVSQALRSALSGGAEDTGHPIDVLLRSYGQPVISLRAPVDRSKLN